MEGFIPDEKDQPEESKVPFWEDASNEIGVVGYTTTKTTKQLQSEIRRAMGFLGGTINGFQSGTVPWKGAHGDKRYAFRIYFTWQGVDGRLDVAALPIRKETASRKRNARRHALYSVMLRLEGLFNSQIVMPGDFPLMPYLLNDKGQTFSQWLVDEGKLPALPPPPESQVEDEEGEVVEGDFREADE